MQKKQWYFMFICLVLLFNPAFSSAAIYVAADTTTSDSIKIALPDYSNVNVAVETAWGTSDKSTNVDVYVLFEAKKPAEIVLRKGEHQECSIELVSGLVVRIIDPKTGRILKQYGKLD